MWGDYCEHQRKRGGQWIPISNVKKSRKWYANRILTLPRQFIRPKFIMAEKVT